MNNNNNSGKAKQKPVLNSGYTINEHIKADQLRVITEDGKNLGFLSRRQALTLAEEQSLDLVQIGEAEGAVIARLMDFGKFLYEKKKQQGEAKKHQKVIQIKELKLRPNIGDQDYLVKLSKAAEFLQDGKRVKFTLQFRGREAAMMNDVGPKIFTRIRQDLEAKQIGTIMDEQESKGSPFWSKIFYVK